MVKELTNKKIVVMGMGKSGIAAVKILSYFGNEVIINDSKDETSLAEQIAKIRDLPIKIVTGGHPDSLLEKTDLFVISPGIPIDLPILKKAKKKGIPIISEVEMAFLLSPAPFIAITGTNGKSTTTTLVGEILKQDNKKVIVAGNIGIPLTEEVTKATKEHYIVAEISSFQLESTKKFNPFIGAFLNITVDHLERHYNFDNYFKAKARLFENMTSDNYAVLNYDDLFSQKIASTVKSKVIYFSRKEELKEGFFIKNGYFTAFLGGKLEKIAPVTGTLLQGPHNRENILAAIAITYLLGVSAEVIRETLKTFRGIHYRIEFVETIDGITFINDSKGTNPGAVMAALDTFADHPIILIAGGKDKDLDFGPLAEEIARKVKCLVLIGESAEKIQKAVEQFGFHNIENAGWDFKKAVQTAFSRADAGDIVLLSPSCASFDMFKSAENRGEIFDRLVRELKNGRR